MVEFLETHGLIKDSQHGFRRGRSCLTNLLCFLSVTRLLLAPSLQYAEVELHLGKKKKCTIHIKTGL